MLKSLTIRNFRLFRHLQVNRLGRVNLIVGKNNSGKSAFLEAVELYASNAMPSVLLDLVESRQETWGSEGQPSPQSSLGNSVRHLFYSHKLPGIGEQGIVLNESSSGSKLHLTVAAYRNESQPDGTLNRIRVSEIDPEADPSDFELSLVAEEDGKTRRLLRLDSDVRRPYPSSYERLTTEYKLPWQVVPTENMPNRKVAALWDLTSLTDLEPEVISAIQLIEPHVSGVAFVEDVNSRGRSNDNRIPLVKIDGIKEPLPLKSMGDGMTRLFHIIVALVNAQNGALLIDEFENGLHWSVQPDIWNTVFRIAERLNVQVFGTTHSRDCVKGFDFAWNEHPSLGAFFRLEARESGVKVTEYNSETLTDAIDMDVEVR